MQVQPVDLHQWLQEVGLHQTAYLHLHTHSVHPGDQGGQQAGSGKLHPQVAVEEGGNRGPHPVIGGTFSSSPWPTSLNMAEMALATTNCLELSNAKKTVSPLRYLSTKRVQSQVCCVYLVDLLPNVVHELMPHAHPACHARHAGHARHAVMLILSPQLQCKRMAPCSSRRRTAP